MGLRGYLVRAVYNWAVDAGFTPHIIVDVSKPNVTVPPGRAEGDRIVLNIDPNAVRGFSYEDDVMIFSARFGGVPFSITVPSAAVVAVYARENGKGLSFEGEPDDEPPTPQEPPPGPEKGKAPKLRRVK